MLSFTLASIAYAWLLRASPGPVKPWRHCSTHGIKARVQRRHQGLLVGLRHVICKGGSQKKAEGPPALLLRQPCTASASWADFSPSPLRQLSKYATPIKHKGHNATTCRHTVTCTREALFLNLNGKILLYFSTLIKKEHDEVREGLLHRTRNFLQAQQLTHHVSCSHGLPKRPFPNKN